SDRPLLPDDQVDEIVVVKPQACRYCQAPLRGDDYWYLCHQVTELPPIRPTVTEYRLHTLTCQRCGDYTPAGRRSRADGDKRTGARRRVAAALCQFEGESAAWSVPPDVRPQL